MRRWFSKRVLLGVVGGVLIVATFAYFLPTIADYGEVWQVVKALSWTWVAALLAVTALNVLTFAPPWLAVLPGLRFWPTLMMTQVTTALSIVVPGGSGSRTREHLRDPAALGLPAARGRSVGHAGDLLEPARELGISDRRALPADDVR